MTKYRHILFFFLLGGLFYFFSSCDFENKIRRLASDPSGRKRDSLKQDEVSSNLAETEPNAVLSMASEVILTKEMREISGELSGTDLTDWFDVQIPESGLYEIIVTPSAALDISLYLEKSNYAFNLSAAGGAESVKSNVLKRVRFGVKREKKTEGSYKIKIVKFEPRKNAELEPNNNAESANPFDLKEGMVGKIDQVGDRDVYKIIAAENERWELQFIPTKGDPLTLKFCEDEELLSCSQIYRVKGETLFIPSFGLPSKKMPLYAVVGSEKVSGNYQLLALPLFNAPNTLTAEIEPNDSFPMEIDSQMSALFFNGYLKNENDIDRFKILNWSHYYYSVQIDDPDLSLEVEGKKIDAKHAFYSCLKSSDEGIEVKFGSRKDLPAFQGHDYHINLLEKDTRTEQEPNNDQETSQVVGGTKRGDTALQDADFFLFEVADKKIEYVFSNLSNQDIDVSISDDEGFDVLAPKPVRGGKTLNLKFDFPKGKYFVKIIGQSKVCSPYQLYNFLSL